MTGRDTEAGPEAHRLSWVPPFLAGLSGAVAGEVSVGLLLYSGAGFLRSLTVVLGTLLGALALGLWTAPDPHRPDLVESLRRRWLLAMVAFVGAAFAAAGWSALGGLGSRGLTQGAGLAFLAGLPLYAVGSVLAGVAAADQGRPGRVGGAAACGATLGAAATGLILVQTLIPASIFVFCLVALSGGALVHGRLLDRREEVREVQREDTPFGTVVVRDRRSAVPRTEVRELLVAGRVRGGVRNGSEPLHPWEAAALDVLTGAGAAGVNGREPVRVVGAGCAGLIRGLADHGRAVEVVDRNPVLHRLAVRHLGVPPEDSGVRFRERSPLDELLDDGGTWAAVAVDASTLGEEVTLLPEAVAGPLARSLASGGMVVVGGGTSALEGAGREALERLCSAGGWQGVAHHRVVASEGRERGLLVLTARREDLPPAPPGTVRLDLPLPEGETA